MVSISILCPSRGRPELAKRMAESAVRTCVDPKGLTIAFYLDHLDPTVMEYVSTPYTTKVIGVDGPTSYAWNELAKTFTADIMILCGDDVVFETEGWDEILRKAATENPVGVFSFDDERSPLGTGHPHPAVTRMAYEALGYIANPMFYHWYVDTWLREVALKAEKFHYLGNVRLAHRKSPKDETHKRIRATNLRNADEETYNLARKRYFAADVLALARKTKTTQTVEVLKSRRIA